MAAHQAPLSLGFSRQEHWSGLPFPSPVHESEKWKWSRSVVSDSSWPHGLQPTRLLRPWDFPGKGPGVGCHCLLRGPQHWPWMMQRLLKSRPLKPYNFKGEGLGGKERLILIKLSSCTVACTEPLSLAQGRRLCPRSWSRLHRPWE